MNFEEYLDFEGFDPESVFGELAWGQSLSGAELLTRTDDRSDEELEEIFWNAAAPCEPTPNMERLLALLREKSIKTGVISNMGFSGASLKKRLKRLFPELYLIHI